MSLVNYSSDEEDDEEEEAAEEKKQKREEDDKEMNEAMQQRTDAASRFPSRSVNSSAALGTEKPQASVYSSSIDPGETLLRLPDASQLLASFDSGKETSAVNVSGSLFTSMKRSELNGSVNGPPKKISKGRLTPSRISPDTAGGSLLPPQLRGRSNVATEDLDKLFTRRRQS